MGPTSLTNNHQGVALQNQDGPEMKGRTSEPPYLNLGMQSLLTSCVTCHKPLNLSMHQFLNMGNLENYFLWGSCR